LWQRQTQAWPALSSRPLPLAFAATSNRLTLDALLSTLTPLSARSQWNHGLLSAQDEGEALAQPVPRILDRIDRLGHLRVMAGRPPP